MQALGYISHSINDLLQPANTATVGYSGMGAPGDTYNDLGGYGDFYTVRDNRKRSKKEPDKLAANRNMIFEKVDPKCIKNYNHKLWAHIEALKESDYNYPEMVQFDGDTYIKINRQWSPDGPEVMMPIYVPEQKINQDTFKGDTSSINAYVDLTKCVNVVNGSNLAYVTQQYYADLYTSAVLRKYDLYIGHLKSAISNSNSDYAAELQKLIKYFVEYYSNPKKYNALYISGQPAKASILAKNFTKPGIFDGITLGTTANDALLFDSLDGTGSAPFGMSCLGNLCTGSDLGKPTIKFEFETNSELADFLKDTQKAAEFAETINPEGSAKTAADTAPNTNRRRNQKAITTDTPLSLMPGAMTPGLPPSPTSPKALPPADGQQTPPLPSFNKVFENPDGIYFDKRRIGDYGYINDNLRYINFYIDKNWTFDRNILKFAEKIFPGAVIIICFVDDNGQWRFYIEKKKYRDFLSKHLPKHLLTGLNYVVLYEKYGGIQTVERLIKAFEAEGKNVVLVYRHIVDGVDEMPQASTPAALPPASTPAPVQSTPDIVVPVQRTNVAEPNWADLSRRFENASNFASFDPDASARVHIRDWKALYDEYIKQIPPESVDAFNSFFNDYVNKLVSMRSRTTSAAVTGPGGITPQMARRMNQRNDSYWSTEANFQASIVDYITKLQRRANRAEFVNTSIDDRYAQRINELKKEVNGLMYLKDTYEHIAKGGEIPEEVLRRYAWMSRVYGTSNLRESILKSLNYNLNLQKATFKDKLTREVSKGNVEIIDAIIDYLKPKGLFTNRAEIWQFPSFVRTRRESVERETQRVADAAADDNALYRVEYDEQEDRVKIYFNGMPSDKIRTWLKQNGFRWSPKNKAWQRQITENARRVVRMFEGLVKDGTLGKPTIKLEFENNGELLSLFDAGTINGDKEPAAIFNCPESQLDCKGYRPTYKILPSYDHLIDPADGQSKLVGYGFEEATLSELIEACKYYRQVARLAQHLKASDALQTAFNIWHFLHTNVRYNYDAPGLEEIRVPARVWADRFSGVDCDCLAVFTACLLLNLGYRPQFEIVGFDNSPKYSHIYVTLDGYPIDRVLPSFLDRPKNITKTKIMDIPVYQLSGCDLHGGLSGIYDSTLRRIATGTASAQDCLDFRKAQVLVSLQGCNPDAATLAEILMPYVGVVADDGAYYFTNANVAKVATEADSELRQMQSQNLAGAPLAGWFDIVRQKVKAASEDVIINNPQCNAPTIVVIINPKREKVQVKGEMVKADLPTVNPLQSEPNLFTATLPDSETADEAPAEKKGSNVLWWALGVVGLTTAAVCMNEKKGKKK